MIKKTMWVLFMTVAALFAMAKYGQSRAEPVQVAWVRPQVFDARDTLKLRGTLRERSRTRMVAARDLIVRRLLVSTGETVMSGQLLAVLEITGGIPDPAEAVFRAVSGLDLAALADGGGSSTAVRYLEGAAGESLYLTSPCDGIILDCGAEEGMAMAAYASLLTVADMDTVYLEIQVDEENIPHLQEGMDCLVTAEALELQGLQGKIKQIEPYASTSGALGQASDTRVGIRVALEEHAALRPGYSAQAVFTLACYEDVITVPYGCVGQDDGGEYILTVREGQVARQTVETGQEYAEGVRILSGVTESDRILQQPDLRLLGKPVSLP